MLPKIIGWINEKQLVEYIKQYDECGRGFSADREKMRELYPFCHECNFDEYHKDALIQEIVNNKYVICGDTHQHLCIPVFSDGYLMVTMRTWADIMDDAYTHIDPAAWPDPWFYMATTCWVKEKLPNEK